MRLGHARGVCIAALLMAACADTSHPPNASLFDAPPGRLYEEARIDGHLETLVQVSGVLVDGSRVVLGQPQGFEVRFFGHDGSPLGSFGREGSGPGEFNGILTMGWMGDTLWVFDMQQLRTSIISPEGELVRTERFPSEMGAADQVGEAPSMARPIPVSRGRLGYTYVTLAHPVGVQQPDPFNDHLVIARMADGGTLDRLVAKVPRGVTSVRTTEGVAAVPWPHRGYTAASPRGERFAEVFASIEGEDAGILRVGVRDGDGADLWRREYRVSLRAIPQAMADSAVASRLEELQDPGLRRALRDSYLPPSYFPPVQGAYFGNDNTLWVAGLAVDGFRHHLVLDSRGDSDPVGSLLVPNEGIIRAGDRGSVWVIETDELGVPSVVQYAVEWD